ncbi:hypothetical protein C0Q70_10292 [Pomacea canaliculata]|uniref:C-type lectin domain-containing protein n=1 Tax=Pomacea canaliculata TaxID=400727 RepID=A0A2T7PC75_POMCA|nr:hypothetical protein C0Q70_10292 [Pomacea canaliculata]
MNYTSALSTCTSKGSILAEARDDVANQFFGSLWPGSEPYIGLTKRSNGSWVWQDGSNTSIYSNYSAGRPYTGNLGLNCTIITNSLGWQDSNCSDARYFACTKDQTRKAAWISKKICADFTSDCKSWVNDIPNFCSLPEKSYMAYYVCPLTCGICRRPCPEGYTQVGYNGDCYRYYGDPMTYSDAQQQCAADGAVLYPAKTASDLLFLLSFSQNSSGVWVGLTDSATEGTWKYSDDTLMTDSSLWMSGEPDNVYQGITPCNCATASLPANLMDYPCGQKQPFLDKLEFRELLHHPSPSNRCPCRRPRMACGRGTAVTARRPGSDLTALSHCPESYGPAQTTRVTLATGEGNSGSRPTCRLKRSRLFFSDSARPF